MAARKPRASRANRRLMEPASESLELAPTTSACPTLPARCRRRSAGGVERGVKTRLIYNVDSGRPAALHPRPDEPEILEQLPIEMRAIAGVPDLMHHKYVVRDAEAVGPARPTGRSTPVRQENVLAIVEAEGSGGASQNFEELWGRTSSAAASSSQTPSPSDGAEMGVVHTRQGEELSQRIATAIGAARERVRIASPVITRGRCWDLAELADRSRADAPAGRRAAGPHGLRPVGAMTGHSAWKIPLLAKALDRASTSRPRTRPRGARGRSPRLHALQR